MKLTDWKWKDAKYNQHNSACKHTNLDKGKSGKLIWNLSVTMDVIIWMLLLYMRMRM